MGSIKLIAIFTAAVYLIIAATIVNAYQLFYMAALLLALPGVSYLVGRFALRDLEFAREVPGTGWSGETVTFTLTVRSRSRLPRLFLQAHDDLPRFLRLADSAPPHFHAAPGGATHVPYEVQLLKRGAYTIPGLTVSAVDPLGMFTFRTRVPLESEMLVYPMPEEIGDMVLSGAERYGSRDLPIAAARGSGVDPDGVREYVPGDPLRRMHWKSVARTGKLNVIEFEESRALNVVLVLDLHSGTDVGEAAETTIEYLVRAAASIAQLAVRQGASVRLIRSDEPDPAQSPGRGTEHLFLILASLARAEANDSESLSARLVQRVGVLQPGTTLMVLTADADPDLPGALAHYTSGGAQVFVLYADALAFGRAPHLTRQAQAAFLEGLYAARTAPSVLRRSPDGRLRPETVQNAGYFSAT